MCGISGVFLRSSEVADPAVLHDMASRMQHRGPDSQGVFVNGPVGLAHRRLKIIDLSSAADQPFKSEDGNVTLVFNGEIYNFKELRAELTKLGRRFHTSSDTEVLLQSYEEWGTEAFLKFNGMFAFALLDLRGKAKRLHLVRDRFGIKPLFYSYQAERLAFASELKPLLALNWISRDLDQESLLAFLKFSHVPTPRSIFRDVRQMEPGCFMTFGDGEPTTTRYFDRKSISRPSNEEKTEAQWSDELDQTLSRVVRRQIESDVPIGCFLSGGIDSSLLACAYSELGLGPIETFTISYGEKEFDEGGFASEVAKSIGSKHHDIPVVPKDLLSLVSDIPLFYDQPFADPTLLPTLVLAKKTKAHVTVALSGDGGDELFFGYTYQRALRAMEKFSTLPTSLRKILVSSVAPFGALLGNQRSQQFKKLCDILRFKNEAELFEYFIGTIGPLPWERLRSLLKEPVSATYSPFAPFLNELGDVPWNAKIDQVFLRTFLTDTVLTKTDRAGMAYGLEARVPFLDNEMVDFSTRLPFEYKLRHGKSKYLLRKLLAKKLPGELSNRRKQGFSIPLRDWFRSELRPLLDTYLNAERIDRENIFSPREVTCLVKEHLENRANHSHLLFSLVSFQLWKERFLD